MNNFKLALKARKKEIEPEQLPPAARLLYRDDSLTQADLAHHADPPARHTDKTQVKRHSTYKY